VDTMNKDFSIEFGKVYEDLEAVGRRVEKNIWGELLENDRRLMRI